MPYQDFAKFNTYELGNKTSCDTIVNDLLGHMTTAMQAPAQGVTPTVTTNVGSQVTYVFNLTEPATGTYDLLMPASQSFTVTHAHVVAGVAGGSATAMVMNGATGITDAIAKGGTDKVITRATTIDDAQATVAPGGTLRVAIANGGATATQRVVVQGILSA